MNFKYEVLGMWETLPWTKVKKHNIDVKTNVMAIPKWVSALKYNSGIVITIVQKDGM